MRKLPKTHLLTATFLLQSLRVSSPKAPPTSLYIAVPSWLLSCRLVSLSFSLVFVINTASNHCPLSSTCELPGRGQQYFHHLSSNWYCKQYSEQFPTPSMGFSVVLPCLNLTKFIDASFLILCYMHIAHKK